VISDIVITIAEALTNDDIKKLRETGPDENQAASLARRNKEKLDCLFGASRDQGQAEQEGVKTGKFL